MMNMLKVGDLIQDIEYGDIGLVIEVNRSTGYPQDDGPDGYRPYKVLYIGDEGKHGGHWFGKKYVEEKCEVLS